MPFLSKQQRQQMKLEKAKLRQSQADMVVMKLEQEQSIQDRDAKKRGVPEWLSKVDIMGSRQHTPALSTFQQFQQYQERQTILQTQLQRN